MAEALGLASSLISLSARGKELSRVLATEKGNNIRVKALMNELSMLSMVLEQIVELVRKSPATLSSSGIEMLSNHLSALTKLFDELTGFATDISDQGPRKFQPMRSMRERELERYRDQIERLKGGLVLFLQVVSLSLTSNAQRTQQSQVSIQSTESFPSGSQASMGSEPSIVPGLYPSRISPRHRRYLDKLTFGAGDKYNLRHLGDLNSNRDLLSVVFVKFHESDPIVSVQVRHSTFRLVACSTKGATSNEKENLLIQQSPNHLPFQRDSFFRIMETFKLPSSFFQFLFTGVATISVQKHPKIDSVTSLLLRTPLSSKENWTLAVSWDNSSHEVHGLLHGAEDSDLNGICTFMEGWGPESAHPFLLPVCLCEMLVESDTHAIRIHATELYQVEFRTNFHGFYPSGPDEPSKATKSPEQDFEEITRILNFIISRLAFHQMRINANMTIMEGLIENDNDMLYAGLDESSKTGITSASQWIQSRLFSLKAENQALLLEIACNQKIAESQLEIVYNLVAQRDNKDNLKMAKISTEIASVTRDDSFAMRTIAVMSIVFLPGTFVSSFFSMGMFDWRAPEASSVLSSRFWIYWAVTIPLTFAVLAIWLIWLHQHENPNPTFFRRRKGEEAAHEQQESTPLPQNWTYPSLLRRGKLRDKKPASVHEEAATASIDLHEMPRRDFPSAPPRRADTLVQGPRR